MCTYFVAPYATLSAKRQARFDLYTLSLINSMYVGGWSLFKIMCYPADDVSFHLGWVVFIFGYFIHDFWAIRAEWVKYPADLLHHVSAFVVCLGILIPQHTVSTLEIIPWFGIVELSTVL